MDQISQYVGEYFSREWVMKNVMQMSEEDIDEMKAQVEAENLPVVVMKMQMLAVMITFNL